ncbi:hypothetical protein LTR53_005973 [Teratosphaeriaceae sp. CCFEE 6253]|nr:hypothetical protein LTR53_005973 [Teratosphaeriaceae sp. CCFEE 6253]
MSEEDEWKALPLTDQFAHKNWKARKNGYETAAKEFKTTQPTDPLIRDFIYESSLWKAAVADSNVAAQQEALGAYNAFLDAAGTEGARKTRSHTVQGIVEKGLMGRPAAKASALESLLLLIELDKADPIIEELLPFLSHKQPKVIAASLSALTAIYHAYGCKTVEPKPVVKVLPKVFGHADKNVRAEAQGLTVELYRWLREAMKPLFWGELKDLQQKDLEKLFEPVKAEPAPKPERLLRSQQAAQEEAAALGAGDVDGEGEVEEEAAEIDLEPEYEAVDVLAKVPKDFSDRLASSKWKDRKDVLDEVFAAVNVPAMQEGPFDDIIRGCAKSMKDANIAVVTVAANCVECIAKGLRKGFTKYRGTILGSMLERLKEKKQSVTDAIGAACDAVFLATNLAEIEADVLEGLKSKNPQVKEHSTRFLIRSLKSTRDAPTIEQTKELAEAAKKLLAESAASLRDAGAEVLGVLWRIMGDRNMLNHLEGLDDIKKGKIKEFCDAAEVRAKWKPKAAPVAKPAPAAAAGGKKAATGKRPAPGGAKRVAPKPVARSPSPMEEAPPAALQPRPTSRPAPGKAPAGLRPPGAGLKAPGSGLAKPGTSLKAPGATAGAMASPKRQPAAYDDEPSTPAAAPRTAPGRGLAGRPLGKPAPQSAPASPPPLSRQESTASAPSALSTIERQELYELRSEVDLLRQQTSDLRQDKQRQVATIAELQNQNAQLIEDHTRDVLLVKAKETQLVRARGEAESEGERGNSLSREIDRLKREIGRLGRGREEAATSPAAGEREYVGRNGAREQRYGGTTSGVRTPAARAYGDGSMTAAYGDGRAAADEGKENIPDEDDTDRSAGARKLGGFAATPASSSYSPPQPQSLAHLDREARAQMPPPPSQARQREPRPLSNGQHSSGRATPLSHDGDGGGHANGNGNGDGHGYGHGSVAGKSASASSMGMGPSQSEGVESWRRAAEVTQNLKARIELMKARQNIGRGS